MPTLLKIKVEDHPHLLEWKNCPVPFFCDGCKELGFGICYQCPNRGCDFVLHEVCAIRRRPPPFVPFLSGCDFQFHKENPLGGTRVCDACALDIQGFLFQCTCRSPHGLHPCCTKLPRRLSLSDTDMEMEFCLREKIRSKCLKCQHKRRPSGKVQGWAYESSDGQYSFHVACMREAWLGSWKRVYFQLDDHGAIDENTRSLALQNLAPNKQVALRRGGQSSKAMKAVKLLITFLRLVVSAIFGDPVSLACNLFQIFQM